MTSMSIELQKQYRNKSRIKRYLLLNQYYVIYKNQISFIVHDTWYEIKIQILVILHTRAGEKFRRHKKFIQNTVSKKAKKKKKKV